MEGVGARLGRSSTRYGPTTVFSGPVRRWKKKWVPLSNPNNANSNNNGNHPHLLLYKWTPISSQSNGSAAGTPDIGKDASAGAATPPSAGGEPLRRRFRYIPVFALEEQKQEGKADDESKQDDIEPPVQQSYGDGFDGNDDVQDIVMVEAQAPETVQARVAEANETNLDLSLGLKSHDGDHGTDSKPSV
ncbi:hypothetical protein HPP92_015733 [Vanilla planifolia]|uniref:Uncharacterized protein n=1 Tax=Vanilla planifolia TaxID=51239 RepID=A0A835UW32_VANPL|nr:hypothetical protein HPP92_015733 [Vanilla planifolia]